MPVPKDSVPFEILKDVEATQKPQKGGNLNEWYPPGKRFHHSSFMNKGMAICMKVW